MRNKPALPSDFEEWRSYLQAFPARARPALHPHFHEVLSASFSVGSWDERTDAIVTVYREFPDKRFNSGIADANGLLARQIMLNGQEDEIFVKDYIVDPVPVETFLEFLTPISIPLFTPVTDVLLDGGTFSLRVSVSGIQIITSDPAPSDTVQSVISRTRKLLTDLSL